MIKLKQLLNEDKRSEALAALKAAFKAGPAETRAFLDGPIGSSDVVRKDILLDPDADEDDGDDKVKVKGISGAPASGFKPTQKEIDLMKSVSYPLGSAKTLIDAINTGPQAGGVVVSGDLIIDGHHRWSGAYAIGGDKAKVQGKDVQWPGAGTKEKLAAAQLAIAAKLGTGKMTPSQSAKFTTNISGAPAEKIVSMMKSNFGKQTDKGAPGPLLNKKMMYTILKDPSMLKVVNNWTGEDVGGLKEISKGMEAVQKLRMAIVNKVASNLIKLPSNEEAPARADMPQFDKKVQGPELGTVEPSIKAGKYNISPPFGESVEEGSSGDYKYSFGNYEVELKGGQVFFRKNGKAVKVIDVKPTYGKEELKVMAAVVAKGVGHELAV